MMNIKSSTISASLSIAVLAVSSLIRATVDASCTADVINCNGNCTLETTPLSPYPIFDCRDKSLTTVPRFSADLHGSANVYYELTLARNRIRSIEADAFAYLRVERLDLSDNPLSSIDRLAFAGHHGSSLRYLSLSLAPGAEFPSAALSSLRNLSTLIVAGFSGFELPPGALVSLSALVELHVVDGGLWRLGNEDLIGQRNSLRRLRLSNNSLTSVPTTAIDGATGLELLDLSTNRIQYVGPNAFDGARLAEIDLSINGLGGSIDRQAFVDVAGSVLTVRLTHCQLTDESLVSLGRLRAAKELRLDFNAITSLPDNLFSEMRQLHFLGLNNNRLTSIASRTFNGPIRETLAVLHLSYNPLDGANSGVGISSLTALRELYLDGVLQLRLGVFNLAPSLQVLSVRNTGLWDADLWPTLSTLPELQTLLASHCSLMAIPEYAFHRNVALRSIDLSYNIIGPTLSQLQLYGLSPSDLHSLSLTGNRLSTIDRCTFVGFPTSFLFQLGLGVNPLSCTECSMQWLYSTLKAVDPIRMSYLSWTCDDGRLFASLTDDDFIECPPSSSASSDWFSNCTDLESPSNGSISDYRLITLHAKNVSDDGDCLLKWTLYDNTSSTIHIVGFTLTFESAPGSSSTPTSNDSVDAVPTSRPPSYPISESLPSEVHQYCTVSSGLLPDEADLYTVCLSARISLHNTTVRESSPVCSLIWIDALRDDRSAWSLPVVILAIGCSIGGILVATILLLFAVFYCRHRRLSAAKSSLPGASWSAATDAATVDPDTARREADDDVDGIRRRQSRDFDKPLVSSDSKRYVKSPRRRETPSAATTSVFQTGRSDTARWTVDVDAVPSVVLSAEQRARFLSMLVAATDARPTSAAEVGDTAPPGSVDSYHKRRRSTGSPEVHSVNGVQVNATWDKTGYSAPELHIYDEIAEQDTYDVIPIDDTNTT